MATEALTLPGSKQASAPAREFWTDDEIMALPKRPGCRYESHDGEIIFMGPAGVDHNDIEARSYFELYAHVNEHCLGRVYGPDTGFRLSPLICYGPDVAFVAKSRLRALLPKPEKYLQGASDLAVEVLSPSDSIRKTKCKIADYFRHDTTTAWLALLRHRQVQFYHSAGEYFTLEGNAKLEGDMLRLGFVYPLSKLFVDPAFD